ncbi:MAG: V4R domain-containing protein [Candidatus Bathyarchaeia archaeon]
MKRLNPFDVGRIIVTGGRKIFGFALEACYEKSVLRQLGELAEKQGVIVRYIQISMPKPSDETAKAVAFIDFSQSQLSPEEAEKILKNQKFVKSVKLLKPVADKFVSDSHYFPLTIMDERALIFRKEIYEGIFKGVRSQFGTAGEAFLYYIGFEIGKRAYLSYSKLSGTEDFEALIATAKAVNLTLGWSILKEAKINGKAKTATITLLENFECNLARGYGKAYSQFYRGAIAGIFTQYFKTEMKAEETKCVAKGDPYCQFEIKQA